VLEQEILNLSNQMLKYELECERLKTQLEEEKRKQKEQENCIKEQQMKIENLNNFVTNSDFKRNQSEDFIISRKTPDGLCNVNDTSDVPGTPCFKSASRSFVVARSNNYSGLSDFSPMVHSLGDVADEDTWMKLNKGFVADLDQIQFTPAVKCQPTPLSIATTECPRENHSEVEDLKSRIQLLTNENDSLQVKFNEQVLLSNNLMQEMSELKQETLTVKEIPNRLSESVANCKDVYKDVIVTMKSLITDKESPTANLLLGTTEITTSLLATLETQFSMIMDGQKTGSSIDHPLSDHWETLRVNLKNTTTLLLSDAQAKDEFLNSHNKGQETAALEEKKLKSELIIIKERYNELEKELCLDKQLLEASRESHEKLIKEVQFLKEERDSLDRKISQSTQRLRVIASDKENALKDLNVEVKRRKDMEEEIKHISIAFATRHKSFVSFHSEIKSKMQKLTTQNSKAP
jgi:centromeric protein E